MKSTKRILSGNINTITGEIDTDSAARAIMTHRNTPVQEVGVSPAVALFGYTLRDHLPNQFRPERREWQEIRDEREKALSKRHLRPLQQPRRKLALLTIGDDVAIQDQFGNHPRKWYGTGVIAEVLPHRQYRVIVDGSRRITLRNRRFLRKIDAVCRKFNYTETTGAPNDTGKSVDPIEGDASQPQQARPIVNNVICLERSPEEAILPHAQEGAPMEQARRPPQPTPPAQSTTPPNFQAGERLQCPPANSHEHMEIMHRYEQDAVPKEAEPLRRSKRVHRKPSKLDL